MIRQGITSKHYFLPAFVVLSFAVVLSQLILAQSLSIAAAFCLLPLLVFAAFQSTYENRLWFLLLTLGFPLTVPFLGKDGGTSTTFIIFFVVLISAFEVLTRGLRIVVRPIEKTIWLLMLLGFFTFTGLPEGSGFTGVRYFYIYIASLCLFLLIIKTPFQDHEKHLRFIETLMLVLILIISVQVLIGLAIRLKPSLSGYFQIFLKGEENLLDVFDQAQKDTGFVRFRTLITAPESTGEVLAVLSPLVLYKFFSTRKPVYLGIFALWGCAQLMTATRSTTFLFCIASITVILIYARYVNFPKAMSVFMCITAAFASLIVFFPEIITGFLHRLTLTQDAVKMGGAATSVLNRDTVWEDAFENLRFSTLLGRGFLPPSRYLGDTQNFHSLYLTLLYQLGWLGAPVFIGFLFYLQGKMMSRFFKSKQQNIKFLFAVCTISMMAFLVNQVKYEFNRHPPYQQFCWALFALFYLVLCLTDKSDKQDRVAV